MYIWFKRIMDCIFSLIMIIVLSPLFSLIILLIKLDSPGPIFFKQKRIGVNKKTFYIYKFRTMKINTPRDMPTHLLVKPEQYITRVGAILRKTSLDEIPQLINIFLGQMSLIGPRPALWNQTDLVQAREEYGCNNILPGLTGWAQINGRDELTINEKTMLDKEYLDNIGITMDIKCFIGTITSVLKSDGVVEGKVNSVVSPKETKRL
ncbi:sugar transferase [Rossellomorea marisflavi]|uniref:Capsular biosynthesis protein n=1 Tax=Rossellomorea marisflavi TaxID=189381 RepID=A0A161RHG7_9BACI|nr:sugar transferase [Rossellomorea marisflavi]KZE43905.1 capsular biosynthesis protein [Rossellomorea marisflavi]